MTFATAACGESTTTTYHDPNGVDVTVGGNVSEPVATYGGDAVQRMLSVDRLSARLGAAQADPAQATEQLSIAGTESVPLIAGALGLRDPQAANRFVAAWNRVSAHPTDPAALRAFSSGAVVAARSSLTPAKAQTDKSWYAAELATLIEEATTTLEQSMSDAPGVANPSQRLYVAQLLTAGATIMPSLRLDPTGTARFTDRLLKASATVAFLPAGAVSSHRAESLTERISTIDDDLTTATNIDTTAPETTKKSLTEVQALKVQVTELQRPGVSPASIRAAYPALIRQLQRSGSDIANIDPSATGRLDQSIGLNLRHAVTGSPLPDVIDSGGTAQTGGQEDPAMILATVVNDLETMVTEMRDELKQLAEG